MISIWKMQIYRLNINKYKIISLKFLHLYQSIGMKVSLGKENKSNKSNVPEYQGGDIEQYMQILYTHQKQCEKTGKYMEADLAKKKLAKMRVELQRSKREGMLTKHEEEKKQVQMAHVQEITEFNNYWDKKMSEYQEEAERIQQDLIRKHEAEAEQFEQQVNKSLGCRQKDSSQLMNLRKIEENLAKQQNYMQAHKVQKQIQILQRQQYQKWNYTRMNKIRNLLQQLRNKQQTQLSAIRQKIQQGFEEQKKIRNMEYEKLIQKYQNFMKELENHHNQEVIKYDKTAKLQSTMNFSKVSNISSMSRAMKSRNF